MSRDSPAPIDPKRLTFMALVAVKEVVDQRYLGPVEPTALLRLALAYLHAVSQTERCIFDDFWRACLQTDHRDDNYIAGTSMFGCWQAMARGAGIPLTIEMMERFKAVCRRVERDNFAGRMERTTKKAVTGRSFAKLIVQFHDQR